MDSKMIQQESFIHERQLELRDKMEEYNKLGMEIAEYKRIIRFCKRFFVDEASTQQPKKQQKMLIGISEDIFSRATVSTSNAKIAIRLYDDLFVEMSIPQAIPCAERRINFLKAVSKRIRSECHFLQSQLNIMLLSLDALSLNKDVVK